MGYWLATPGDQRTTGFIKRFDPRFWSVNFPRPMMAAVTTASPQSLRVDAVFYQTNDLCGLIWEAEDSVDHPLLAYATARDFTQCSLSFRWQSNGVIALDAINGPTLTIEGRDASGAARSWYVRLWNYASGAPEDAVVTLDFANIVGGFALPGDADPVWAGDVDRMFVSLVAPGYTGAAGVLPAPAEGWAELSAIMCDGPGSTLAIGDVMVPAHGLRIATGYDDGYNLTPARLLRNMLQLGYRGPINHYVGMSHYFRLDWEASVSTFLVSLTGGALNTPCIAWHADFATRAKALGYDLILSLSYELLDQHCWNDWKQRAGNGDPALTGWVPPSTLLSPAHAGAMAYLQAVATAFVGIAAGAAQLVRFQIGEPWWWVMSDGRICLYDDAAKAAFGGSPVAIDTVRGPLDATQTGLLDQAGVLLASSTAALAAAVKAAAPDAELLLLVYMPTVLDPLAPELRRADVPTGWAHPAFDVLQLEDYDWVTGGGGAATAGGIETMTARLGYPLSQQHYLAGFVLSADQASEWAAIDAAGDAARARGTAETFVWALPQVLRDGFTHYDMGDAPVQAFDDVDFPLALRREASVTPGYSTAIVTTASGIEQRNADWAQGRLSFDAGPGVRSQGDIATLVAFFRARRGAARAFRCRDPFDDSSAGMTDEPGYADQLLGTGDGTTTRFDLVKRYGDGGTDADGAEVRRITRPVTGSVRVGVAGIEQTSGWSLVDGGAILFSAAPAAGAAIAAGFRFDVPVRFAQDTLEVSLAGFLAGEAPQVPLIEIREG